MNKNSINEVAKTYQRLVEAASQSPPMPLEAPDSDEVDTYSPTGDPLSDSALRQIDPGIIQGILNQINDILQQLANCNQTNNCEYLKSEYIRLTRYLQALQGLVESAPPEAIVSSTNPGPNPDFSSVDISYGQSLSGERPDRGTRSVDEIMREVPYNNMRRLLLQINLCYQNGNCTQEQINNLIQQYYRWLLSTV